ncbi:MAG: hypothetical protein U1E86_06375 [Burkholderiaceae bacterium]
MTHPAGADLAEIVGLLRRIADDLAVLRAHAEFRSPGGADDAAAASFVRETRIHVEDRAFSAIELAEHALLPASRALREAVEQAAGSLEARRIGRALARVEGRPIDGLRVERIGTDRDGIIWRVSRVRGRETRAAHGAAAPGAVQWPEDPNRTTTWNDSRP